MTKRKGRRKNRKIKFSEQNYVEKNYFRKGKAVIPVKLDKIEDLYMRHDYKQMELSDSVCNYIEEIAYMIPINTDIIIEIHCQEIDEEMQNKIKKSIKNNYGMEIDDNDYDLAIANKRSVILTIIGIILLIINVMTENYIGSVISNFLSVVWWVAIWEMVEIQMIDNSDIKWKRLNNLQLYDSTVEFVFDKVESKII
jgi:hypothetical protein